MSKKRQKKEQRLEYIKNLMKETGSSRVNASEIARQFGCDEKAVRLDLQEIYREMGESSREKATTEIVKMDADLLKSLRILADFISSDRPASEKIRAIETQSRLFSDYINAQSKLGLFKSPEEKGENYPVIVFNNQTTDMDAFIEFACKKNPEIKKIYEEFSLFSAETAIKERQARDIRLKGKEVFPVNTTEDMKEAVDKHGLSVDAIRANFKEDVTDKWGCKPDEYWCGLCEQCHPKGSICWTKIKSGKGHRIDPGDFSPSD